MGSGACVVVNNKLDSSGLDQKRCRKDACALDSRSSQGKRQSCATRELMSLDIWPTQIGCKHGSAGRLYGSVTPGASHTRQRPTVAERYCKPKPIAYEDIES
jgi:hypothetical protein